MNSTNSSKLEVSPHLLWYNSTSSTMALISPGVSLVISLSCIITLNTYLKKLHETFKTLLNIILTFNILIEISLICLNIYMMSAHHQDFIICLIRTMLSATQTYMTTFCITMMSFLRYHIAWKITNLESTKKTLCYAISITIWYCLFELFNTGFLPFAFAIFYKSPSKSTVCAAASNMNNAPILPIYNAIKVLVVISIGVRYDYLMIKFLKKKNTHPEPGQAKLVPWKSGGEQYNILVPTVATIASLTTGISGGIVALMLIKSIAENNQESWKNTEFVMNTAANLQMPVLIGLTLRVVKHNKTTPVVIPKGPMFHDNENEEGNQMEMVSNENPPPNHEELASQVHVLNVESHI